MRDSELPMHLAYIEFEQDETSIEDILASLLHCYPEEWTAGHYIGSDLTTVRELLEEHQLITVKPNGARPWTLTPRGVRVAKNFADSLKHGALRRCAVQKALLKQVGKFSDESADSRPPTNDLIGQLVGKDEVTSSEHRQAVRVLMKCQFIKGTTHEDNGLLWPVLTLEGMRAAEHPRSPEDFYFGLLNKGQTVHNGDNYTNNNSGEQGVVGIGKKVKLTDNTVAFSQKAGKAREKVAEIKTLLGEIEDVPPTVESQFLALEAVSVDPEADESRWEKAVSSFQTSFFEKFGEASWVAVAGAAAALPTILGLS